MIVERIDPISGRRLVFEAEPLDESGSDRSIVYAEPLDEPGANRSIVYFEDLFQYNKSYADFPVNLRERESVQLMHFETHLRQIAGASPSWWDTLLGWIENIDKYIGPLIDLYKELEEAGIITHEQAEQAEAEGWTKEELTALIRAQMAPAWERYLPWIIAGGIGVGLLAVLLRRPAAPVYVAR
ncbi:hypothetical protein ES702_01711 [subsurface metagenome]